MGFIETESGWRSVQTWTTRASAAREALRAERIHNVPFITIELEPEYLGAVPHFAIWTQWMPQADMSDLSK